VGDELQYERGALRRFDGSIPLDKIQTITIEDTPLKRTLGYATLRVETAGYTPGQGGDSADAATAVPLATRGRVLELANDLEPFGDPDFERPPKRVRRRYLARYLLAVAAATGGLYALAQFVSLPLPLPVVGQSIPWYLPLVVVPVLPVAAHLKWIHRGWWLGPVHAVTRNGVLRRRVNVVPYYRIQTVIDSRSPFQRRWRLATVTIDTAGSLSILGSAAAAVDVDFETADRLRQDLDERLRTALAERRAGRRPAVAGPSDGEPVTRSDESHADRGRDVPDAGVAGDARSPGTDPDRNTDAGADRATGSGTERDIAPPDESGGSDSSGREASEGRRGETTDRADPWDDWQTNLPASDDDADRAGEVDTEAETGGTASGPRPDREDTDESAATDTDGD
jgi:putative membrane protein